jgi:hypothetical protein
MSIAARRHIRRAVTPPPLDGTKQGTANAWPDSYADEPLTLVNDSLAFRANPGPVTLSA